MNDLFGPVNNWNLNPPNQPFRFDSVCNSVEYNKFKVYGFKLVMRIDWNSQLTTIWSGRPLHVVMFPISGTSAATPSVLNWPFLRNSVMKVISSDGFANKQPGLVTIIGKYWQPWIFDDLRKTYLSDPSFQGGAGGSPVSINYVRVAMQAPSAPTTDRLYFTVNYYFTWYAKLWDLANEINVD